MKAESTYVRSYLSEFERLQGELACASTPWLDELRQRAISDFAGRGLPSTRDEDWKYTSLSALGRRGFSLARPGAAVAAEATACAEAIAAGGAILFFIDGHLSTELSRLDGLGEDLIVGNLRSALSDEPELVRRWLGRALATDESSFVALNTAFIEDGAFVYLPEGSELERPLNLVFFSAAGDGARSSQPRNLIVAGEASRATITERYLGAASASMTNSVSELFLGRDAEIDYLDLQDQDLGACHFHRVEVEQAEGSSYHSNSLSFGAALARTEMNVRLSGEGASCRLDGLFMATGSQHLDNHTVIDHASPGARSEELYKGVVAGEARGVFTGKVLVRHGSQKTEARQKNNNLLLSSGAQVDSRPQLEIYNDDVICTHGATTGQLDREALFYLLSRGLEPAKAQSLLTRAFIREVLDPIADASGREDAEARTEAWLASFEREVRA